jgi:hypothetical protein
MPPLKFYVNSNYKGLHGLGPHDLEHGRLRGSAGGGAHVRSSFSLIYQCLTEGYQDTLDADTGDKLHLETDIRSTVDFVFGYDKIVFLGCWPLVRSSIFGASQPNVITAQGCNNFVDRSGFALQNCSSPSMSP